MRKEVGKSRGLLWRTYAYYGRRINADKNHYYGRRINEDLWLRFL